MNTHLDKRHDNTASTHQGIPDSIRLTFEASKAGRIHFGEVVDQLTRLGVESYHVDYRSGRVTYYLPDGQTVELSMEKPGHGVGDAFEADALRAAILGAQQGRVMYPKFKRLSQQAGCIGYTVWIAGRHVTYFGRRGDIHVEHFPS